MALQNLNARLITDQGLRFNGAFGDISVITPPWQLNTTWAQFVTRSQYNGGLFNLTWALDKPAGTYTQTITLKNGNYAVETVTIAVSGDSYTTTIDVKLYRADNTLLRDICDFSGGVTHGRHDHFLVVVMYNDTNNHWVNVICYTNNRENTVYIQTNEISASYSDYIGWMLGSIAPNDPYGTQEDNETPSGGFGDFDYSGDDDLPPALPSVSAAQVGFVSLWNPSAQNMKDLATYMWTNNLFDIATWKKLFADPMDCILTLGIVPVTPNTNPTAEPIYIGNMSTNINSHRITDQFQKVDFGRLHINGQSASYMDYSPYAKASIFLPYCGTYALDVDDIMDADIDLEYHIDIYTGACVAYVTITRTNSDGSTLHSTLYQFTGNVLATIPVTGADHAAFLQSLLFMGAGIAATVATAGAGAPAIAGAAAAGDVATGAIAGGITAGSAINTVMSMKPDVQRSGNLSSTAGFLGKQKPCVTIRWSNLCRPEDEYKLVGMPLHKSGTLSDFEGFTVVDAVHMDNILCTDAERDMIVTALRNGVII